MDSTSERVPEVGAVIVSYNGGAILGEVVDRLVDQVGRVFIVDNASEEDTRGLLRSLRDRDPERLVLIENPENRGLAAGLNQGLRACEEGGFTFVLTMDQDSRVAPGMVRGLVAAYTSNEGSPIGLLSPNTSVVVDGHREHGATADPSQQVREIGLAWTGGSLVPCAVYREVGPFREDYFIDYVDYELCHRIRKAGYRLVHVPWARMLQRRGNMEEVRWMGRHVCFFDNYSPIRHYYITRNGIILSRELGSLQHLIGHFKLVSNFAAKVVLFEDRKLSKLGMMLQGLRDGLMGRTGRHGAAMRIVRKRCESPQAVAGD